MTVLVADYVHRTGEHCASTALRNLLSHEGTDLSEGMVFGLASGLGFFYLTGEGLSPSRMFHGRTISLESDFGRNTGVPLEDTAEGDDERAWRALRRSIEAGKPVLISTDTFYLGYHHTSSHFPGHRCVVVGYDDATETVLIADRKFEELQRCGFDELRRARNAPDYPMPCNNQYGIRRGALSLGVPMEEAVLRALRRTADGMLSPGGEYLAGIPAMRSLASDFASWSDLEDWSWAARFGYQVVIKRGAGGKFFRSLYADFLREAAGHVPAMGDALPAERMDAIALRWCDLAAVLKEASEREKCDPQLFRDSGRIVAELAESEAAFFEDARSLCDRLDEAA